MTFDQAIEQLASIERPALEGILVAFAKSSGLRRQAVDNIGNETRLRQLAWVGVIEATRRSTSADDLHLKLVAAFRLHQLAGGAIPDRVQLLTRVITSRRYSSMVADRIGVSEASARRFVTRLLTSDKSAVNASTFLTPWRENRTVWATFDANRRLTSGVDGIADADTIRGILGLDPTDRGEPLLVFDYELPIAHEQSFPTIAEAYAGEGWQVYFRPAPTGADAGLTMTWNEFSKSPPRPELVHTGFDGGTFVRNPREVR